MTCFRAVEIWYEGLYCTVLNCSELYSILVYSILVYSAVLCCAVLCCALFCSVLYCTVLTSVCAALCWAVLCAVLLCHVLSCLWIVLFDAALDSDLHSFIRSEYYWELWSITLLQEDLLHRTRRRSRILVTAAEKSLETIS